MKPTFFTELIKDHLNELLEKDPTTINKLVHARHRCSNELTEFPYIVTQESPLRDYEEVGMMGIINGALMRIGQPRVCACYEDTDVNCESIAKFDILAEDLKETK